MKNSTPEYKTAEGRNLDILTAKAIGFSVFEDSAANGPNAWCLGVTNDWTWWFMGLNRTVCKASSEDQAWLKFWERDQIPHFSDENGEGSAMLYHWARKCWESISVYDSFGNCTVALMNWKDSAMTLVTPDGNRSTVPSKHLDFETRGEGRGTDMMDALCRAVIDSTETIKMYAELKNGGAA